MAAGCFHPLTSASLHSDFPRLYSTFFHIITILQTSACCTPEQIHKNPLPDVSSVVLLQMWSCTNKMLLYMSNRIVAVRSLRRLNIYSLFNKDRLNFSQFK